MMLHLREVGAVFYRKVGSNQDYLKGTSEAFQIQIAKWKGKRKRLFAGKIKNFGKDYLTKKYYQLSRNHMKVSFVYVLYTIIMPN